MPLSSSPIRLIARSQAPMPGPKGRSAGDRGVHQHPEVELLVFEHGAVTMLYGGRSLEVPPERLALFWGAMPHQALDADPRAVSHVVYLPVPMLMHWQLPAGFMRSLLDFEVLIEAAPGAPAGDLDCVKHWIRMLGRRSVEADRIVLLEVEARLRRMALDRHAASVLAPRAAGAGRLERMVETIARRCLSAPRAEEVAREAGLTRAYAARLFRRETGMTMLEYITRQRISHAQRLLATTNRGVLDIMGECGFKSPTRFYAAFRRYAEGTPAQYRRRFFPAGAAAR
ncbi:MAG: helix-turn-helix domain-containing protein [Lentisphaerae bacterium]|nr:helix-turn-helix domain-containing protein [Lentisphaerota bacterium]